ncbi:MAG: glutamate synthase [Oscillospiraceae bacterium]|jgi:glutamate synthase domain-containing protein 3|nr:glutamate synthase [Oscillospiraceae bacterium]
MTAINAKKDKKIIYYKELNETIRNCEDKEITLEDVCGQRYIGDGINGKKIVINGTPGNGLCAYMNGAEVIVNGNAQDATGDTMNEGTLTVYGSSGDATGYGMRGGKVFIRDNAGYRAGIHMKEYKEKFPVLIIGGETGSFLGEYQAGGVIIVLGLANNNRTIPVGEPPVGNFCGTGMHGGRIYLRCDKEPKNLPKQVAIRTADEADKDQIKDYIAEYSQKFDLNADEILSSNFYVLSANSKNPYKQLYTHN